MGISVYSRGAGKAFFAVFTEKFDFLFGLRRQNALGKDRTPAAVPFSSASERKTDPHFVKCFGHSERRRKFLLSHNGTVVQRYFHFSHPPLK